jgi:DNA-binding MarR family transcriptional regulator
MPQSTDTRTRLHAEVVREIRRFIAGVILHNQKIAEHFGLRLTDMQCLNVLDLVGPATPSTLAEQTGLTTGGVTVMLDRLEKAGLVKRERNPADRRSLLIRVNPKKWRQINRPYADINRQLDAYLRETSQAELKSVLNFFTRMNSIRPTPPPD